MKKKTTNKKAPDSRNYKEIEDRITELDTDLITLETRMKDVGNDIDEHRQRWMQETVMEGGKFFQATLNSMLHDLFDFMKEAPVWEIKEIRDVGVLGANRSNLKPYYDTGWRMLGFCYDEHRAERVGVVLHRPRVPETFEEFQNIYEKFLVGKAAPQKRTVKGEKKRPVTKKVAKKRSSKKSK